MSSFISVLSFQTSSCSGENLAGGLLAVSNEKIWFKSSDFKLEVAKLICGRDYETSLKQILQLIQNRIDEPLEASPGLFSREYFSYLNNYSKGILQFSEPKSVGIPITDNIFDDLFKQFIGERPHHTEGPIASVPA